MHNVSFVKYEKTSNRVIQYICTNLLWESVSLSHFVYIVSEGATIHQLQKYPDLFAEVVDVIALNDAWILLRSAKFHYTDLIDNGLHLLFLAGFHVLEREVLT